MIGFPGQEYSNLARSTLKKTIGYNLPAYGLDREDINQIADIFCWLSSTRYKPKYPISFIKRSMVNQGLKIKSKLQIFEKLEVESLQSTENLLDDERFIDLKIHYQQHWEDFFLKLNGFTLENLMKPEETPKQARLRISKIEKGVKRIWTKP